MAEVTKERLQAQLEAANAEVAELYAVTLAMQNKLRVVRDTQDEIWKMADLGDVPEWEVRVRAVKVG